eukprot:g14062.t1
MSGTAKRDKVLHAGSAVTAEVWENEPRVALLSLHAEPVNVLSTHVWREIRTALAAIASPTRVCSAASSSQRIPIRAVFLQSALKRDLFTAGGDLREVYPSTTSKEAYREHSRTVAETLCYLYTYPLLTVALEEAGPEPLGGR